MRSPDRPQEMLVGRVAEIKSADGLAIADVSPSPSVHGAVAARKGVGWPLPMRFDDLDLQRIVRRVLPRQKSD